jgi:hypothetical protein
MSLKILEARRVRTPYTPVATGRTVQVLGGLEEAKFECGCGHIWTAVSSSTRMNGGFFFQSNSGVTAECPKCKATGKLETEEYDDVL